MNPIRCIRGPADREAPPIDSALISSEAAAVAKGKRFLDDPAQGGYYSAYIRDVRVHKIDAAVVPGAIVRIESSISGISAAVRVESVRISGVVSEDESAIWVDLSTTELLEA